MLVALVKSAFKLVRVTVIRSAPSWHPWNTPRPVRCRRMLLWAVACLC